MSPAIGFEHIAFVVIQRVNIVIGLIKKPYEKEKRIIYNFVFVLQLIELVD